VFVKDGQDTVLEGLGARGLQCAAVGRHETLQHRLVGEAEVSEGYRGVAGQASCARTEVGWEYPHASGPVGSFK
jgi:hypothetical protein